VNRIKVLLAVFTLLSLMLLTACGSTDQSTGGSTQLTPTTTSGNAVTVVSPVATNAATTASHSDPAVLGAQLSVFTAKFGQQNDHSSPGRPHLARCGNSNVDQLILSQISSNSSTGPITSILYASCSTWTVSMAESLCSTFFPIDAVYQKTVTIPGSPSHFPSFDKIYYSAILAHEVATDNFTNANRNPVEPGLFDANYLYENENDTSHIGSCKVQLGTQQTK
jgi:hypothetical protein